jgi:hypothetical protein
MTPEMLKVINAECKAVSETLAALDQDILARCLRSIDLDLKKARDQQRQLNLRYHEVPPDPTPVLP